MKKTVYLTRNSDEGYPKMGKEPLTPAYDRTALTV